MYVLLEYLTYLAIVSFFGLILFGATVLGLFVKTGAGRVAGQAANKLPHILSKAFPPHAPDFAKGQRDGVAHS